MSADALAFSSEERQKEFATLSARKVKQSKAKQGNAFLPLCLFDVPNREASLNRDLKPRDQAHGTDAFYPYCRYVFYISTFGVQPAFYCWAAHKLNYPLITNFQITS